MCKSSRMKAVEKFITVYGKKVHYYESLISNPKDTVVLLHGKSFKAETWISINADIHFNDIGLNFIAIDYPGWGQSESNEKFWPPTEKYENASIFIEEFSKATKLKRFSLLGASFSGPFIVSFAFRHPENINKLLFIGTVWSEEIAEYVASLDKPALIMYGANDTVIPKEASEKYKKSLRNNKFIVVDGARHPLYLDKPEVFFNAVKDFFS